MSVRAALEQFAPNTPGIWYTYLLPRKHCDNIIVYQSWKDEMGLMSVRAALELFAPNTPRIWYTYFLPCKHRDNIIICLSPTAGYTHGRYDIRELQWTLVRHQWILFWYISTTVLVLTCNNTYSPSLSFFLSPSLPRLSLCTCVHVCIVCLLYCIL